MHYILPYRDIFHIPYTICTFLIPPSTNTHTHIIPQHTTHTTHTLHTHNTPHIHIYTYTHTYVPGLLIMTSYTSPREYFRQLLIVSLRLIPG